MVITFIILMVSIVTLSKTRNILNPVKPKEKNTPKTSEEPATQEGINTLKLIFLQIESINKEIRMPDPEECEYIKYLIQQAQKEKVPASILTPLKTKLSNICPKT